MPRSQQGASECHRFVICGLPGAGKTSWVQQRGQPGDLVWDYDAVAATLLGVPGHDHGTQIIGLMMSMLDGLVAWLAANPYSHSVYVIVSDRARATEIAQRINAELVVLQADDELREKRLAVRRQDEQCEGGQL